MAAEERGAADRLSEAVTISTKGRFHAFDLARELQTSGCLKKVLTSLPGWHVARFGVDPARVTSILLPELIDRTLGRALSAAAPRVRIDYAVAELYDKLACARLGDVGRLFVGWSSFSLRTMREAKARGAITVVERGSTHIEFQRDILANEYRSLGIDPVLPDPRTVEKELREYAEADYVSIPSSFVRRTFLAKGVPEDKLIQTSYGVNLLQFKPGPKTDRTFRIIFSGGIGVRKGVHYLLRAFAQLRIAGAELWLIGSLSREGEQLLAAANVPGVRQLGPFPQGHLTRYYSQGSVFCLPSIEEGMSMAQVQAMACGLPVIATPNTGAEDILRDGIDGFVVPARDVVALKDRLSWLHANEQARIDMGRSARARVEHSYSWRDYGSRICGAYQRICRDRERARRAR